MKTLVKWNLFLDDERIPEDVKWIEYPDIQWTVCRTFDEAKYYVEKYGIPSIVSFDNDLGGKLEGYDFAKWMVEYDIENRQIEPSFTFYVHSMNPVAASNIMCYMRNYLTTIF